MGDAVSSRDISLCQIDLDMIEVDSPLMNDATTDVDIVNGAYNLEGDYR